MHVACDYGYHTNLHAGDVVDVGGKERPPLGLGVFDRVLGKERVELEAYRVYDVRRRTLLRKTAQEYEPVVFFADAQARVLVVVRRAACGPAAGSDLSHFLESRQQGVGA